MRFVHPRIETVFEWPRTTVPVLVIENQGLFRQLLNDIRLAIHGYTTAAVLSREDRPISFSKHAEWIVDFLNFELNQKSLLAKICTVMEQTAVTEEHYLSTQILLSEIENNINDWAFGFPCDIVASKVTVASLLKAVGISLREEYDGENGNLEKLVDYMELVREFDGDKLFVTVNMRDWFSDESIQAFMHTVLSHEYKVLMIEACSHSRLCEEQRVTIDMDLCEF